MRPCCHDNRRVQGPVSYQLFIHILRRHTSEMHHLAGHVARVVAWTDSMLVFN